MASFFYDIYAALPLSTINAWHAAPSKLPYDSRIGVAFVALASEGVPDIVIHLQFHYSVNCLQAPLSAIEAPEMRTKKAVKICNTLSNTHTSW